MSEAETIEAEAKPADDAVKVDDATKVEKNPVEAVEAKSDTPDAPVDKEDWRDRLVSEVDESQRKKYRKNLDKFASEAAYGKSYLEMLKKFEGRVEVPGEDADDEALDEFWRAVGAEKDPAKYTFERPELLAAFIEDGDISEEVIAESEKEIAEFAAASRIPVKTAQAMYAKYLEVNIARRNAMNERANEVRDETQAALKEEYGKDFEANLGLAKDLLKSYAGDDSDIMAKRLEDGTMIGDIPEIVRCVVDAARNSVGEQRLAEASMDDGARSSVQEQIDAIYNEHGGKPSINSDRIQTKLRGLFEKLHGTAPADGRPH